MASIFARIVNGEIPSYKIAENQHFFAFLDISPLRLGHTLVIPKEEVDYIFDADEAILSLMLPFCKIVADAIRKAIPCNRIGVTVIGLEVPHAHIHLIPISALNDMNFSLPKLKPEADVMQKTAASIRAFIPHELL
jgi:histidine triad (HIT) family protein